ncbi:MAG TPA: pyrroline-5-carboxylate reductase [bacterium]|nr:pyrroline-5-carboxylate reductase [bacterium]
MKYAFIGGGNMGRALAAALVGKGVCLAEDILVVEPAEAARERVANLGCVVAEQIDAAVSEAPVVLLAVKPQSAPHMFEQLKPHLKANQVVVSIMAGVTIDTVHNALEHEAIVRVMPNTPAQVGLGMNVYHAAPTVTGTQLRAVEALLQASGESLAVANEDAIDAATAVSGSGPAYVFYIAEHWTNAALKLGFTAEEAEQLVQQTLIGATALWKDQRVPPATLREQVTSKGGTTAAALEHFEQHEIGKHFEEGVERAYQRAKELGG